MVRYAQSSTLPERFRDGRLPIYRWLVAFAASCFVGTLATDIAYWRTADMTWSDFSDWLLTAGVLVGWATIVVAPIETIAAGSFRRSPGWHYTIGHFIALILATVDMLVHTRDAWTSVVPWGLVLSSATVLVLILTSFTTRRSYDAADTEVLA